MMQKVQCFFMTLQCFALTLGWKKTSVYDEVCGFCGKIPKTVTLCLHDPSKFTTSSGNDLTKSAMIQA